MKKPVIVRLPAILALSLLALSMLALAGCGNKATVRTPEGEVTLEDQGGRITINEGGESATMSQPQQAPTEAELGIPIYPGSTYDAENSGRIDYASGGSQVFAGTAQFLTGDSLSKVVDWYTGKLGAPLDSTPATADWMVGDLASGNYSAMHIEKSGSQVKIAITHMAALVP